MDEATFQAQIAGTVEQRDVQARQVSNGFVLAGNRRFLDPGTSAVKLAQSVEGIAADAAGAASAVASFLTTGAF